MHATPATKRFLPVTMKQAWIEQGAVLKTMAKRAELDFLTAVESLAEDEKTTGLGGNDGGASCAALRAEYWQCLSTHNSEMSDVSRQIAWARTARRSSISSTDNFGATRITSELRECDTELELITQGRGEEGMLRASHALVAHIEADMLKAAGYSLRERNDREIAAAQLMRQTHKASEQRVQRKLDELRVARVMRQKDGPQYQTSSQKISTHLDVTNEVPHALQIQPQQDRKSVV